MSDPNDGAADNFDRLIEKLQANFQDYDDILIDQAAGKLMTSTSFSAALKNGEALEYIDNAKKAYVAYFGVEPTLDDVVELVKTNSAAAGRKIKEKKKNPERKERTEADIINEAKSQVASKIASLLGPK